MHVLIQYRVKKDRIDEQKAAIRAFVAAIDAMDDSGIEYSSFQLPDEVSFKHVVRLADEAAKTRLQSQPFFQQFATELDDRCDEEAEATPLTLVASTRS
ncbi:MAG: hypothetical protein GKR89_06820 [Candidatus Latescibacteria bacterium]|nr:hypothetical protein [Candidatus Latescibacterota bacterium]